MIALGSRAFLKRLCACAVLWGCPRKYHGAARRRRSRAAPRHLRRRGRHAEALSRAPQQQPNHELFPPRGKSLPLPLSSTHTKRLRGSIQNLRGRAPHKESKPTSEITPPHMSAFHSRTRPRPAHPKGASRAHTHLSSLHVLSRAQRTRVHFCPLHWLLCHLGLYKFEFEFGMPRIVYMRVLRVGYGNGGFSDFRTRFECIAKF
jgi:hypothetical protein